MVTDWTFKEERKDGGGGTGVEGERKVQGLQLRFGGQELKRT